jgi:hypothetical protein
MHFGRRVDYAIIVFSISSAKANYYLVTVMPLLALQIACWLEETGGVKRSGALILGAICAVLALALFVSAGRQTSPELLALGLTAANLMQFCIRVCFDCNYSYLDGVQKTCMGDAAINHFANRDCTGFSGWCKEQKCRNINLGSG